MKFPSSLVVTFPPHLLDLQQNRAMWEDLAGEESGVDLEASGRVEGALALPLGSAAGLL